MWRYNAVFATGLVRNNVTRHSLDTKTLNQYTIFCKRLLSERDDADLNALYAIATHALMLLISIPDLAVNTLSIADIDDE